MKAIEIIKNLARPVLVGGLGGFLSLGISASAWGGVCEDGSGASLVIRSSGPQSCKDFSGQFGCEVVFDEGTRRGRCSVTDPNDSENVLFTVTGKFSNTYGFKWSLKDPTLDTPLTAKANTVIVNEVNEVDEDGACSYIYANEATFGSRQGLFEGSEVDGSFANVQSAWFCTDGEANDTPLPDCSANDFRLQGVKIDCADVVPAGQETIFFGSTFEEENSETGENQTLDADLEACSCNMVEPFTTCDENALAGDANQCMGVNALKALTVQIELGNDGTWICRTIGGERQCWKR